MRVIKFLLFSFLLINHTTALDPTSASLYLGSREGDPGCLVENVSVIHGDYSEIEVDLTALFTLSGKIFGHLKPRTRSERG